MKDRLKVILNSYLRYFIINFTKTLLYFSIIIYIHLNTIINVSDFFQKAFLFFIGYASIYFFNDYIDRERDLKRKIIDTYKIALNKKELIFFGTTHFIFFSIILLYLNDFLGLFLMFICVLIGIFRSFLTNKELREISLVSLSFFKLFLIYYFVYNTLALDFSLILLFIYISLIYSAFYYFYKYYNQMLKMRKIIYYFVYLILAIFLSIYIYKTLQNLPISIFILILYISLVFHLRYYKKLIKDDNKRYLKLLYSFTIAELILLFFFIFIRFFFLTKF